MASADVTDRFLAVDADRFTVPMANALLNFTVADEVKQRVEQLAEKVNCGTITAEEHAEYLRIIEMSELMSLFQAKARHFLSTQA